MRRVSTTWPRAVIAIIVGALICCTFVAAVFAFRYWAAVDVFTFEDWVALTPDVRGWLIDSALGLGFGIGLWAVVHAERRGGIVLASLIGALAMFVAPQINAVFYMLDLAIPIDWWLTLETALARAPLPLVTGAVVGSVMWRIAYGGPRASLSSALGGEI